MSGGGVGGGGRGGGGRNTETVCAAAAKLEAFSGFAVSLPSCHSNGLLTTVTNCSFPTDRASLGVCVSVSLARLYRMPAVFPLSRQCDRRSDRALYGSVEFLVGHQRASVLSLSVRIKMKRQTHSALLRPGVLHSANYKLGLATTKVGLFLLVSGWR